MKSYQQMQRINGLTTELDMLYHMAARKVGVSDSTLRLLYAIWELGDACLLGDVLRLSGITKQTANSALRNLERRGILYLEQAHGKSKRVCLTSIGRDYLDQTAGRLYAAEVRALGNWPEADLEAYIHFMQQYNDSLRLQVEAMAGIEG